MNESYIPPVEEQLPEDHPYVLWQQELKQKAEREARQKAEKAEKKNIRRIANSVGLGLLLIEFVGVFVLTGVMVVLTILFPNVENNVFYEAMQYALYAPAAMIVPSILAALWGRRPVSELVSFEKHSPILGTACIMLCFLFVAIGNYVAGIIVTAFPQLEENLSAALGANPTNGLELVMCILYMAAIPALAEEFAFRGVALGLLRPLGDKFAIVISALAFGLMHGNFVQIPFAFILGLALGYVTVRTGSVWPAVIVHFINNATSCCLEYYDSALTAWLGDAYSLWLYGIWVVVGLIGLLIVRIGYRQPFFACCKPYQGALSAGKRTGVYMSGVVWMIGVLLYLLLGLIFAVVPVS